MSEDTIAAIATPLGEGGLAVIRISGREALAVAARCFEASGKTAGPLSAVATHTVHYGHVIRNGERVDEVLLTVMRAPRTFTREDVAEFACHGGILAAKTVLDTVLESGARLAQPGEFTRRAFLNGRIDLAQAEAVADLIHSRTELALRAANEQLAGKLSARINQLRDRMLGVLAHVEAHIDFPEEDIAPDTRDALLARLEQALERIQELLHTANEGRILRRGIRAAIVGRPNAGKSSLLNLLLGHDRAIVSPIPGTTRDTIEETANIRGIPVVFIDTAGLREARDELEQEGMRRSRRTLESAELVLHVVDGSEPRSALDEKYIAEFSGKKRLLVRNKVDLPLRWDAGTQTSQLGRARCPERAAAAEGRAVSPEAPHLGRPPEPAAPTAETFPPIVDVSCVTGAGLENLKDEIKKLAWSGEIRSEMLEVMINSRHQEALKRTREALLRTVEALRSGAGLELVAMELRIAVNAVGEIVGKTSTEDLLDAIFSQFCIGK